MGSATDVSDERTISVFRAEFGRENQLCSSKFTVFYRFSDHGSCHGICRRIQAFYTINLLCTEERWKKRPVVHSNYQATRYHNPEDQSTNFVCHFIYFSFMFKIFTVSFCLFNVSCLFFHVNYQLSFNLSASVVLSSAMSSYYVSSNFKIHSAVSFIRLYLSPFLFS